MILRVSDHALLRFLQRGHELPIEDMREQLALDLQRLARPADALGAGQFAIKNDGLTYVVKSGIVVTVLGRGATAHFDEVAR
jgi:hypothetical protein